MDDRRRVFWALVFLVWLGPVWWGPYGKQPTADAVQAPLGRAVSLKDGETAGPEWATERWRTFAAGIVEGEVAGVPEARMVVACTVVRDVEAGWSPWGLGERWYGWRRPSEGAREAIDRALEEGCQDVPRYAFVGNLEDARHWHALGWVEGPVDLFLGAGGQAVVGVPAERGSARAVSANDAETARRRRRWRSWPR